MGRKIPGRKHRGIRDPEKQAAIRFESIKNKINTPPTNPDDQEVSKTLQRIIDLKNKAKTEGRIKRKRKQSTKEYNNEENIKPAKYIRKPEKPVQNFVQLPNETNREFVNRVNRVCMEVVKEAEFEEKYAVEIKRNSDGEVEGVVKREKDELDLLVKKIRKNKLKEEKGIKKKKKQKDKAAIPRLSKWQKRQKKLKEKQERKEYQNIDEFKEYKDQVKFGEIAHAPPSLVTPRKVEKIQAAPRPGNKNLLLKSMIDTGPEKSRKVETKKSKDILNKTNNKLIDKKGKRKDLPNSLRRQLDMQQKEIIDAYKQLKAKKYNK